jgi:hypothetical protein
LIKLKEFDFRQIIVKFDYDDVVKIAEALDGNPDLRVNSTAWNFRNQLWTYRGLVDEAKIKQSNGRKENLDE